MSGPQAAVGDPACRGKSRHRLRYVLVLAGLALGIQLALGVAGAGAHQWNGWHWNRGGSAVSIYVWDQTGGCGNGGTASNDALYDIYWNPHPIYIYCTGGHTDVSLFQAYEPGAWYCGLAEVWGSWDFWNNHISHGHSRWNTACTSGSGLSGKLYAQQIFCQEFGHALGLDHSNTYDCMGGSYYSGSNGKYYFGNTGAYYYDWDHQTNDLYWMYRYH
jgi:hypothetical protein